MPCRAFGNSSVPVWRRWRGHVCAVRSAGALVVRRGRVCVLFGRCAGKTFQHQRLQIRTESICALSGSKVDEMPLREGGVWRVRAGPVRPRRGRRVRLVWRVQLCAVYTWCRTRAESQAPLTIRRSPILSTRGASTGSKMVRSCAPVYRGAARARYAGAGVAGGWVRQSGCRLTSSRTGRTHSFAKQHKLARFSTKPRHGPGFPTSFLYARPFFSESRRNLGEI